MRAWKAWLAALLLALSAAAERVEVTGTRVSIEPPAGFTAAERFPGFAQPETGASIMVSEMPAPVSALRAGMTKEGLATRGLVMLSSEVVTAEGRETLLIAATQEAGGVEVQKWLAISGDESNSLVVVGTFPREQAAKLDGPMRQALLSVRRSAAPGDRLAGLPFTIEERGQLKIATRVSNSLLLTENGVQRTLAPGEPMLVAAASFTEVDLSDLQAFAEGRIRQTEQLTGPWTMSGRALTVGGMPAWEIEGQATDKPSGQVLKVYQLIVRDGARNYFIVQAMTGPDRWEALLPQFREVGQSLRKRGG